MRPQHVAPRLAGAAPVAIVYADVPWKAATLSSLSGSVVVEGYVDAGSKHHCLQQSHDRRTGDGAVIKNLTGIV